MYGSDTYHSRMKAFRKCTLHLPLRSLKLYVEMLDSQLDGGPVNLGPKGL